MDQWSRLKRHFQRAEGVTAVMLRQAGEVPDRSFQKRVARLHAVGRLTADAVLTLSQAAEVRNLNNHDRQQGDKPIAMPSRAFVDQVAAACEELEPTVRLGEQFGRPMEVFAADRPLREALLHMRERDFSQVVVDVGRGVLRMLTTEDVAHWLMERIAEGEDDLALIETRMPISAALPERKADSYIFMGPDDWLSDALGRFRHAALAGKRLQAIVLTQDGTAKAPAIGIVTPHDLPGVVG